MLHTFDVDLSYTVTFITRRPEAPLILLFLSNHHLVHSTMQSSSSSSSFRQQFLPVPDSQIRARQHSAPSSTSLHASIWAPQPQSPGGIWPKDVQDYGDPTYPANAGLAEPRHGCFPVNDRPFTKEDVFGLPGGTRPISQTRVGAIGEGRQKELPFREAEVCQHFRAECRDHSRIHPHLQFIDRSSKYLCGMKACRVALAFP